MYLGRIVEIGERDAVFNQPPLHPYTRVLIRGVAAENRTASPRATTCGASLRVR